MQPNSDSHGRKAFECTASFHRSHWAHVSVEEYTDVHCMVHTRIQPGTGLYYAALCSVLCSTMQHYTASCTLSPTIAARIPPHGPLLYVTIADGLYPKLLPPKWFSIPDSADGML